MTARCYEPKSRIAQLGGFNDSAMKILVVDVGGSNIKIGLSAPDERLKAPSDPQWTAARMLP